MITILIILTLACIIAILALLVTGIAMVFWPVLIVLGVGLGLDITMLVLLLRKRR